MSKTRIAINGFGRIGRCVARILMSRDDCELVAVNDPSEDDLKIHLFKYDSNFGTFPAEAKILEDGKYFQLGDHKIRNFRTRNISELTWGEIGVDIVLECTGAFRTIEGCQQHIDMGAKKVLLSAPPKSEGFTTVVMGVNEEVLTGEETFVSNASCTTNCLAPVAKVLDENFGIERGLMTTIHSYTNDQRILDVGHKDFRRARAAGLNMIPTTTGAAAAVGKVLPQLAGKLNGISVRVPTPTVSLVDLTVKLKQPVTVETVNQAFADFSVQRPEIMGIETAPLVSSDYKGEARSTVVVPDKTMLIDDMVKVLAWYDNEWGYSCRMVDMAMKMMG